VQIPRNPEIDSFTMTILSYTRTVYEKVKLHVHIRVHRPIIKSASRELVMKHHLIFKGTIRILAKDLSINRPEVGYGYLYACL
jgi:hypothetical protein